MLTGGGGRHYYFVLPDAYPESWPNLTAGVDYLAAGHLAVLPPSIHPTGIPYRWARAAPCTRPTWAPCRRSSGAS